jgi:hypothetical protein
VGIFDESCSARIRNKISLGDETKESLPGFIGWEVVRAERFPEVRPNVAAILAVDSRWLPAASGIHPTYTANNSGDRSLAASCYLATAWGFALALAATKKRALY